MLFHTRVHLGDRNEQERRNKNFCGVVEVTVSGRMNVSTTYDSLTKKKDIECSSANQLVRRQLRVSAGVC